VRFLGIKNDWTEYLYRIFDVAYWTHYHKCPTDERNRFTEECADKWLKEEINRAVEDGAKAIVCLGRDVEKWVEKNV